MEETALDDGETLFEFYDSTIDPSLAVAEWLNIGVIGHHEDGEFVLYDQPEANGGGLAPKSLRWKRPR